MKKTLKIISVACAVIVVILLAVIIYGNYKINKGDVIKWQGKWYTKEQFAKMYPPQYYEAPAKNTPEDAYTKFREALLQDDVEGALKYITAKSREQYKQNLQDKNNLERLKQIPEVSEIKKNDVENYSNMANYYIEPSKNDSDQRIFQINFVKNLEGYWEIDSI